MNPVRKVCDKTGLSRMKSEENRYPKSGVIYYYFV